MSFKPSKHSNPGVRAGAGPATGQYYVTIAGERGMSPDGWHWGYLSGRVPELVKIKGPLVPGTRIQFKRMHGNTATQWAILRDRKVMPQHSAGLPGATGMPGPGMVGFDAYSMHPGVRVVVPPAMVPNPMTFQPSDPSYGAMSASGGTSQNGWPASKDSKEIDIVSVKMELQNGRKTARVTSSTAGAFEEIIRWWEKNIEPVKTLGSFNYRAIRGATTTLSNHSSGTAIDINAADHPLGAEGTVPSNMHSKIGAKARSLGLKWGGDYRGRKDEMHFEVNLKPDQWRDHRKLPGLAKTYLSAPEAWAIMGLVVAGGLTTTYWVKRAARRRRERRANREG